MRTIELLSKCLLSQGARPKQISIATRYGLLLVLVLTFTGCRSLEPTAFAPFEARLDPVPGGGAYRFVLVNTSGKELHNLWFTAESWDNHDHWLDLPSNKNYRWWGKHDRLGPGKELRFKDFFMGIEGGVVKPISRVVLMGHCDEGKFTQSWRNTGDGHLQPFVAKKT